MKSIVGVYDSHEIALGAVKLLKNKKFSIDKLSLEGRAKIIDDHMRIKSKETIKDAGVITGISIGAVLGALSGKGVFFIPGLGFIYQSGFLIGAFAGFYLGLVAGGIISILTTMWIKKDKILRYNEHLDEGSFLVLYNGSDDDIEKAKSILCNCGKNLENCYHNFY